MAELPSRVPVLDPEVQDQKDISLRGPAHAAVTLALDLDEGGHELGPAQKEHSLQHTSELESGRLKHKALKDDLEDLEAYTSSTGSQEAPCQTVLRNKGLPCMQHQFLLLLVSCMLLLSLVCSITATWVLWDLQKGSAVASIALLLIPYLLVSVNYVLRYPSWLAPVQAVCCTLGSVSIIHLLPFMLTARHSTDKATSKALPTQLPAAKSSPLQALSRQQSTSSSMLWYSRGLELQLRLLKHRPILLLVSTLFSTVPLAALQLACLVKLGIIPVLIVAAITGTLSAAACLLELSAVLFKFLPRSPPSTSCASSISTACHMLWHLFSYQVGVTIPDKWQQRLQCTSMHVPLDDVCQLNFPAQQVVLQQALSRQTVVITNTHEFQSGRTRRNSTRQTRQQTVPTAVLFCQNPHVIQLVPHLLAQPVIYSKPLADNSTIPDVFGAGKSSSSSSSGTCQTANCFGCFSCLSAPHSLPPEHTTPGAQRPQHHVLDMIPAQADLVLEVDSCDVGTATRDMVACFHTLMPHHLTTLHLTNVRMQQEAYQVLGSYLESPSCRLASITLKEVNISAVSLKQLCACLALNTSVHQLNLGCNPLGQLGPRAPADLQQLLLRNTSLLKLDLSYTGLGSEAVAEVLLGAAGSVSLTHLDLSQNRVSDQLPASLLLASPHEAPAQPPLTHLNLGFNWIQDCLGPWLLLSVTHFPALTHVWLDHNTAQQGQQGMLKSRNEEATLPRRLPSRLSPNRYSRLNRSGHSSGANTLQPPPHRGLDFLAHLAAMPAHMNKLQHMQMLDLSGVELPVEYKPHAPSCLKCSWSSAVTTTSTAMDATELIWGLPLALPESMVAQLRQPGATLDLGCEPWTSMSHLQLLAALYTFISAQPRLLITNQTTQAASYKHMSSTGVGGVPVSSRASKQGRTSNSTGLQQGLPPLPPPGALQPLVPDIELPFTSTGTSKSAGASSSGVAGWSVISRPNGHSIGHLIGNTAGMGAPAFKTELRAPKQLDADILNVGCQSPTSTTVTSQHQLQSTFSSMPVGELDEGTSGPDGNSSRQPSRGVSRELELAMMAGAISKFPGWHNQAAPAAGSTSKAVSHTEGLSSIQGSTTQQPDMPTSSCGSGSVSPCLPSPPTCALIRQHSGNPSRFGRMHSAISETHGSDLLASSSVFAQHRTLFDTPSNTMLPQPASITPQVTDCLDLPAAPGVHEDLLHLSSRPSQESEPDEMWVSYASRPAINSAANSIMNNSQPLNFLRSSIDRPNMGASRLSMDPNAFLIHRRSIDPLSHGLRGSIDRGGRHATSSSVCSMRLDGSDARSDGWQAPVPAGLGLDLVVGTGADTGSLHVTPVLGGAIPLRSRSSQEHEAAGAMQQQSNTSVSKGTWFSRAFPSRRSMESAAPQHSATADVSLDWQTTGARQAGVVIALDRARMGVAGEAGVTKDESLATRIGLALFADRRTEAAQSDGGRPVAQQQSAGVEKLQSPDRNSSRGGTVCTYPPGSSDQGTWYAAAAAAASSGDQVAAPQPVAASGQLPARTSLASPLQSLLRRSSLPRSVASAVSNPFESAPTSKSLQVAVRAPSSVSYLTPSLSRVTHKQWRGTLAIGSWEAAAALHLQLRDLIMPVWAALMTSCTAQQLLQQGDESQVTDTAAGQPGAGAGSGSLLCKAESREQGGMWVTPGPATFDRGLTRALSSMSSDAMSAGLVERDVHLMLQPPSIGCTAAGAAAGVAAGAGAAAAPALPHFLLELHLVGVPESQDMHLDALIQLVYATHPAYALRAAAHLVTRGH